MNDAVLVANHTQIWPQKQAGITLKLAYRKNEVGEVPFFYSKEVQYSYHEYYKADITTGNINDINVTYIANNIMVHNHAR